MVSSSWSTTIVFVLLLLPNCLQAIFCLLICAFANFFPPRYREMQGIQYICIEPAFRRNELSDKSSPWLLSNESTILLYFMSDVKKLGGGGAVFVWKNLKLSVIWEFEKNFTTMNS